MEQDDKKVESAPVKIDENMKDIIKKANSSALSEAEIKKLIEENKDRFDFDKIIKSINLKMDKYVVFTDGKEQLVYEDGEFFVVSVTDASHPRKKIKRKEARDMYLEYFIKYQINPFLRQKELSGKSYQVIRRTRDDKENVREGHEIVIDKSSTEDDIKKKLEQLKEKEDTIKKNREVKEKTLTKKAKKAKDEPEISK